MRAVQLLQAAKEIARRDGTTLRELLEEGLRSVVQSRSERSSFRLRKAFVGGKGLVDGS